MRGECEKSCVFQLFNPVVCVGRQGMFDHAATFILKPRPNGCNMLHATFLCLLRVRAVDTMSSKCK